MEQFDNASAGMPKSEFAVVPAQACSSQACSSQLHARVQLLLLEAQRRHATVRLLRSAAQRRQALLWSKLVQRRWNYCTYYSQLLGHGTRMAALGDM